MDNYEVIKMLVTNHDDKTIILKVLGLCDDPAIPVVTQHTLNKRIRIAANTLERILYFLSGIHMLNVEKVGRASIYLVSEAYGGRLLDELKGDKSND